MKIKKTKIEGCFEIIPKINKDNRGLFIKTFHQPIFKKYKLETDFKEEYYSVSKKNVLRGLHFQKPPMAHAKLVYCVYGEVFDVVLDIRKKSKTYGKFLSLNLSAKKGNILYIPTGLAHGFQVLSDKAIMMYKTTTVYSPKHDTGILWNSVNIPWPNKKPIVSKRDKSFGIFSDFGTDF